MSGLLVGAALALIPTSAIAQDADAEDAVSHGEGNAIIVTGARSSLQSALIEKRGGNDFEDVNAAIIGSVKVIKAPSADTIAGPVFGTITLRIIRSLDINDRILTACAQGEYSELSETVAPRIATSFGNRWDVGDGESGVVLDGFQLGSIQVATSGVIPVDLAADSHDPSLRFSSDTGARVTENSLFCAGFEWQADKLSVHAEVSMTSSDKVNPNSSTIVNFINPNAPLNALDANGNPTNSTLNENAVPPIYDLRGNSLTFGIDFVSPFAPTVADLLVPGPDNFDSFDGRELAVNIFLVIGPDRAFSDPDGALAILQQAFIDSGTNVSIGEAGASEQGFFDIDDALLC